MRRFGRLAIPACTFAMGATGALAGGLPAPTAPYSADVLTHIETGTRNVDLTGRVASTPTRERREQTVDGEQSVAIVLRDQRMLIVLMPEAKRYFQQPGRTRVGRLQRNPLEAWEDGECVLTPEGSETVNGVDATKYAVSVTPRGAAEQHGFVWLTSDQIPVKVDGASADTRYRVDLTNLRIGPQAPTLFEIPEGYRPMPHLTPGTRMESVPGVPLPLGGDHVER